MAATALLVLGGVTCFCLARPVAWTLEKLGEWVTSLTDRK